MKKVLLAVAIVVLASLIGCGGGTSSNKSGSGSPPTISSIQVTPTSMTIGTGAAQQFTATAQMSDSTTKDITSSAQWSSSDSTIASVTSAGVATGSAPGTVTITAQSGT